MAERITKANLEALADNLTNVMHALGMIADDARIVRYSAYGGHTFHVANADTSVSNGFAGLPHACVSMREAYDTGRAVLNALWAVKYAREND